MTQENDRAIELEVEVVGTPEQVWEAIATGPGVSAWFVPTTIDPRVGGDITQEFGPGMTVTGKVQAWEPPHRLQYGEHATAAEGGMAFEFLVETRDGGTCIVRLVNSGFGHGEEWDEQYDATENGWRIFLHVLALHLRGFAGQDAARVQAMAMAPGTASADAVWDAAQQQLGVDGDRFAASGTVGAPLAGTVTLRVSRAMAFSLDAPTPGTGFVAIEPQGGMTAVSCWLSLYGPDAAAIAERDAPHWQAWVEQLAAT